MHLGVASTRLFGSRTYGIGIAWRLHNALGWKAHRNCCADADLTFDEGLGKRQTKAGSFIIAVEIAVDLAERGQRLGDVFESNADTRVSDLEDIATIPAEPMPRCAHCSNSADHHRKNNPTNFASKTNYLFNPDFPEQITVTEI